MVKKICLIFLALSITTINAAAQSSLARTICGAFDLDPGDIDSDPNLLWNQPFSPAGSIDAQAFFNAHPIWQDQQPYLIDRPSQPWVSIQADNNS